jgi:parallel beta-helix repeat protein
MRRLIAIAALVVLVGVLGAGAETRAADPALTQPPASASDVQAFGATGDGRTDDTVAIQKAVDSGVGDLRFARGVYRISRPIVVELDKVGPISFSGWGTARLLMSGPGPAIKLRGTHRGTADPKDFKPGVWQRQRMPTIDGLEIVGSHAEACGIEADGTMQLTVTRANIRECLHAIRLLGRNRNVIVAECHLYHNRGVGIYLDNVDLHQTNVSGCHISYNGGGGIVSRAGNVRNLQIAGCDIEDNMSPVGPSTANVLIDCTGGAAGTAEVAITGCTLQHGSARPDSANIRFLGESPGGGMKTGTGTAIGGDSDSTMVQPIAEPVPVSISGGRRWGHLTIANNILTDVQVNIDLQKVRGASIMGNSFGPGGQYDMLIVDCSNIAIGPNVLDRSPSYESQEQSANGGVLLQNCKDMTISGLHVVQVRHHPAGIVLEKCRRVNLSGCTILDCSNAGILLKEASHCRVSGCLIRNDRPAGPLAPWVAVKTEGGSGNMIAD